MDRNTLSPSAFSISPQFNTGMLRDPVASDPTTGSESFQQAFDRATVGIFKSSVDGRFLKANPMLARILGYATPRKLIETVNDIATDVYVDPRRRAEFARILEVNGAVMHFDSQIYRHNGQIAWISENAWGVPGADGAVDHYEGFVEDITQQKLAGEVKRQADNTDAASQVQNQFMANISHEIRTPLNGVIGMLDLLSGTELTPQQQRYARIARVSADSLLSLINDLLDFSEIETGRLEFDHSQFNLQQLLEDIADMFIHRIEAKGLELALHLHPAVPQIVYGDAERLRQIVVNLVSNAIKFTERGEVVMRASVVDETDSHATVRFTISDTGIGIPPERMNRLFKSFSQVDASTTRRYGGMGLGLAVSKHLIDHLGGRIGVESEVGKGSTFHFNLRLQKLAQSTHGPQPPADLTNLRILAVDDNVTNLEILQAHLTAWKYSFALADSGAQALELLEHAASAGHPFEVAILDMQMPGMDGLELAQEVKRRPAIRDTVLVMLTSTGESMSRERMIARGLSGYLSKPVRQSRLFDAIVSAAASRPHRPDAGNAAAAKGNIAAPKFPNARILLAEDNEINQIVTSEILFRAGYRCDIVTTGRAALEAALDGQYDLILMDCQMPDLDGFEATRAIREHERDVAAPRAARRIPIVALTANAAKGDREHCLSAGMDAYVTKPIDPSQLIGIIDTFLAAAQNEPPAEIVARSAGEAVDENVEPAFHLESLLHRCLGDATFCTMILQKFADRSGEQLAGLSRSISVGNAADLALQAHTLKGVAANLSADDLRSSAANLERAARAGELAGAPDLLHQVESQVERCLRDLPRLLAELAK